MRTAITLAIHKGGELVEMVAGPLTSIDEQRADFKAMCQSKTHPQFERIEFWESGVGRLKYHNFREDQPAKVEQPASKPAESKQPTPVETANDSEDLDGFDTGNKSRKRR
jgi:hypothetical protein